MSEPLRIVVVEDEPVAREHLVRMVADVSTDRVVRSCADGREALAAIDEERPDLLLLDIEMPGLDGLELVRRVDPEVRPAVVFVTAYDDFAVRAFDVRAVDYLLKPVEPGRLREAIERCRELRWAGAGRAVGEAGGRDPGDGSGEPGVSGAADWLVVRRGERRVPVRPSEVLWIESAGNYVRVHTMEHEALMRASLAELEERLEGSFARIHRGVLVNVACIRAIRPVGHGDHVVTVTGGRELALSRRFRDRLEALFGRL